jgi:hypothetical protein
MGFDYKRYLASREWALKKEAVRKRSGGWCERCYVRTHESTHHLTYAHIGNEPLDDLLGVCNQCHEYLSAKRQDDPSDDLAVIAVAIAGETFRAWAAIDGQKYGNASSAAYDKMLDSGRHAGSWQSIDCFRQLCEQMKLSPTIDRYNRAARFHWTEELESVIARNTLPDLSSIPLGLSAGLLC